MQVSRFEAVAINLLSCCLTELHFQKKLLNPSLHPIFHHTQAKPPNPTNPAEILGMKANADLAFAPWTQTPPIYQEKHIKDSEILRHAAGQLEGISVIPGAASSCWWLLTLQLSLTLGSAGVP